MLDLSNSPALHLLRLSRRMNRDGQGNMQSAAPVLDGLTDGHLYQVDRTTAGMIGLPAITNSGHYIHINRLIEHNLLYSMLLFYFRAAKYGFMQQFKGGVNLSLSHSSCNTIAHHGGVKYGIFPHMTFLPYYIHIL